MKKSFSITFSLLWISIASIAQELIINDVLTNGESIGKVVTSTENPGTFTNEGWQPGVNRNQNHILYDVPFYIENGYIEFEIKGMTYPVNIDDDPAFCAMYDGRGFTEPIKYFDDFKYNFYRWNVHFRGDKKVLKCVLNLANQSIERQGANLALMNPRDFFTEPNGDTIAWQADKWYKLKVEWKGNSFALFVDGQEKWKAAGPYKYAPYDHKIWLGSAPGHEGKYTATVPGLTFRNFKLYSYSPKPVIALESAGANLLPDSVIYFLPNIFEKEITIKNLSTTQVKVNLSILGNFTTHQKKLIINPDQTHHFIIYPTNTQTHGIKKGALEITSESLPAPLQIKLNAF